MNNFEQVIMSAINMLVKLIYGRFGKVDNTADTEKEVKSAGKLTAARKINGVEFDGTKDIAVRDDTKLPLSGGGSAVIFSCAHSYSKQFCH